MANNLTREDIANYINNEFGLTKYDCSNIVNDIIEIIIEGLINDKIVKIHNFGTFKIRQKKSRVGRNPKTKIEVTIPSRKVISFTPSKFFVYKINKKNYE